MRPWSGTSGIDAVSACNQAPILRPLADTPAIRLPIRWIEDHLQSLEPTCGADRWPSDVEPNRAALTALVRSCAEQGLVERPVSINYLVLEVEPFVGGT